MPFGVPASPLLQVLSDDAGEYVTNAFRRSCFPPRTP